MVLSRQAWFCRQWGFPLKANPYTVHSPLTPSPPPSPLLPLSPLAGQEHAGADRLVPTSAGDGGVSQDHGWSYGTGQVSSAAESRALAHVRAQQEWQQTGRVDAGHHWLHEWWGYTAFIHLLLSSLLLLLLLLCGCLVLMHVQCMYMYNSELQVNFSCQLY